MTIQNSNIIDIYDLFKYIKKRYTYTAILESLGQYDVEKSRYSIIGVIASNILREHEGEYLKKDLFTQNEEKVDYLEVLDEWITIRNSSGENNVFQTGVIGYISYTEKKKFERHNETLTQDVFIPSLFMVKYDVLFFYDRKTQIGRWVFEDEKYSSEIEILETNYYNDVSKDTVIMPNNEFELKSQINMDFTEEEYLSKIRKTIEYIRNGDIFQANITERFSAKYSGDPIYLYESLRNNTPNPFFAYLDFEYPLISTSPERFFRINNSTIYTNPIKGTVRCSIDGKDQKDVLLKSEKNLAENTMIVDLMRNDIGRVCKQGSVEVVALCELCKFNLLYHLESIIKAEISERIVFSDVLKATFPGGSITGAPKIRAMEIIEELETTQRGPYTGALGFWGSDGYIDTAIAIRIVYFDKSKLYFHAGGGIVVDSLPEHELQELMLKVESIKNTINQFGEL